MASVTDCWNALARCCRSLQTRMNSRTRRSPEEASLHVFLGLHTVCMVEPATRSHPTPVLAYNVYAHERHHVVHTTRSSFTAFCQRQMDSAQEMHSARARQNQIMDTQAGQEALQISLVYLKKMLLAKGALAGSAACASTTPSCLQKKHWCTPVRQLGQWNVFFVSFRR